MKNSLSRRLGSRALIVLALGGGALTCSRAALAQSDDSALEAETANVWQQAKALLGSGKFSEAAALLAAQQTKLNQQLGADNKVSQTNQKLLSVAQQMGAAAGAPAAAPAAAPSSSGKTFVKPEDMERTKAALARSKEARAQITAGNLNEGLPKLDEALGVLEQTLGPDSDLARVNRELLLALYKKTGRADLAAAAEARAATARSNYQPPGQASPETQATMQKLVRAMAAFQSHDFDTALTLFEEAGPEVQRVVKDGMALVNFTSIHASLNDYATHYDKAEELHKKALADVERLKGADSIEVAPFVESLVTHYMRRSEPDKAIPYATRSVAINRKNLPNSLELADALRSLGDLKIIGDDPSGLNELGEAMTIVKNHSPLDQLRMLGLSDSLARAAEHAGDPAGALELKVRACEISQSSGDPALVEDGRSACIEAAWGQSDFAKAATLLEQSLAAAETKYSTPRSIMWAPLAHNLALARYARGQRDAALTLASEVEEANEKHLSRELATGGDAQKRATFETYRTGMNDILSMGGDGTGGPQAVRLALTTLLRRKGRALDASADTARAFRYLQTPEQRQLLERQQRLRGLMAGLVLRGNKDLDAVAAAEAVKKLEIEEEEVTKQLVQSSEQYRALTQPVTLANVQQQLPADTALVEYVSFIRRDPKNLSRPLDNRYYAYVLRSTGEPRAFDLGDAAPIAQASDALRSAIRERRDPTAPAQALDRLVMQPLRAALGNSARLLVSPDDDLNLVPFAALKDARGKYLLEQYEVDYLTSGRDLLHLSALQSARSAPVVLGNPDFDSGANAAAAPAAAGQRSGDLARARFSPLPGTEQEIQAIQKLLSDSRLYTGSGASKSVLQGLQAPLVLHVATHGFFLDTQHAGTKNSRGLELDLGDSDLPQKPPTAENPLIRSGIALSGANDKASVSGILTALEASNIDLDGTRLVVLSACETGLGQVEMGDGVYGLRRALLVAGSQTQVMSLWKVDDNATRDLMIGFYDKLREGRGRGESLRQVQLKMLASKEYAHPYFWAAFIPSGNWMKMDFVVNPRGGTTSSSSGDSSSSNSSSEPRSIVTSDGTRAMFFLRRLSLSNLLNQPDRSAWTLGFSVETDVFSGEKP
ncbi:MAG TPA: CHAT domain-containing protein, partial [Polyangiaceae bacterium]|nr:CHAT domain-containing protein [Polyangiaceae bacterium]